MSKALLVQEGFLFFMLWKTLGKCVFLLELRRSQVNVVNLCLLRKKLFTYGNGLCFKTALFVTRLY